MKQATLDERRFANAVAAMPEDALSAARSAAASRFLEVGFPDTRQEDWRYTNLGPAVAVSNDWLGSAPFVAPQPSAQESELTGAVDAHWIAIRNGLVDIGDSQLPDGVSVTRLANDRRAQLGTDDAMSQFNASLLRDGLRIVVTSAATLDKPLGILVADTAAESAAVSQVRIQVQLEAGAAASFVEAHVSRGDGRHFCNAVLEFELARDSEIDYLRIQQRARQHIQIGKLAVRLAERAKFRHGSFDLGGSLIRNDIVAELLGSDSRIELYGLYLAGNQQHVDNHTSVYHRVGPSTSREEYRGILNRRARCVFNGKAVVDRGADGADAQQANHNLLLSDDAEIDTKPELEIYADDVKCSHGATVGQLDRTAMFYLRSRGLDEASATQLLMRAFAAEVIGMMTVAQATGYLSQIVDRRLDELTRDANDG